MYILGSCRFAIDILWYAVRQQVVRCLLYLCKLITDECYVYIGSYFSVYSANFNPFAWLCDEKEESYGHWFKSDCEGRLSGYIFIPGVVTCVM